jgi:hypothetical protein
VALELQISAVEPIDGVTMVFVAINGQRHPNVAVKRIKTHSPLSNRASIFAIISLVSPKVPGFFDLTIGNWTRRVRMPECEERRTVRMPSATRSLTFLP